MADERWLREAIRLAAEARARGDDPFGALLVLDGERLIDARNAINTECDVTQHAELRLLSKATRELHPDLVAASTLYTSTEPCAMCAGAIYWAGVSRVVFGLAARDLEEMTDGTGLHQPIRRVLGASSRKIAIDGPLLEAEARVVHEGFW